MAQRETLAVRLWFGYLLCVCSLATSGEAERRITLPNPAKTPHMDDSELPMCTNFTVSPSDAENFVRQRKLRRANFATFHLNFPQSVKLHAADNVYLPHTWQWTSKTQWGAYPYLQFDFDAGRLSFGILDFYTLKYVPLDLTPPGNCSLVFGEKNTTQIIANALGDMIQTYFSQTFLERNYSIFCHTVKLDPFSEGQNLYYFYMYFGFWKDLTAYSCCEFERVKTSDWLNVKCSDKPVQLSQWPDIFYFIGLVFLMYFPIPVSMFCDYILKFQRTANYAQETDNIQDNTDDSDDADNEETPLLNDVNWASNHALPDDEWIYMGIDKPVTVISLIGRPFRYLLKKFPLLVSRVFRLLLFSVLFPLPVYIKVTYYYVKSNFSTTERLKAGIPVGFLSVPYGFHESSANWLTVLGGPIVVLGVYLTIGQIFVCLPKNMSTFIFSVFSRTGGCRNTLLSMDLSRTEQFGAMRLKDKSSHALVSKLLKANLYTVINPIFWKFAFRFSVDRFHRWFAHETRVGAVFFSLAPFYWVLCAVEAIACVVYFGCPAVFYGVNMLRAFLKHHTPRNTCRVWVSGLITVCLLFNFYAFFLIFIRGSVFLLSAIDYTYTGTLIYPNVALGFVIGISTMFIYLGRSSQKLSDSYLAILYEIVKINLEMEGSGEKENSVTIRDKTIVLNHKGSGPIENIEVSGIRIALTTAQRQVLVLSQRPRSQTFRQFSRYIRWQGPHPGIPSELFYYVAEKHRPLRVAVFVFLVELSAFTIVVSSVVTLVIAFNHQSTFTLPAQVVTAIMLTVLPKVNEFFTSQMERVIAKEVLTKKLMNTVENFYSQY